MHTVAFRLSLILISVIPWENVVLFEGLGTVSRATGLKGKKGLGKEEKS